MTQPMSRGKSPRKTWSQRFLNLAGSAPDFPYPQEPRSIELEEGKNLEGKQLSKQD